MPQSQASQLHGPSKVHQVQRAASLLPDVQAEELRQGGPIDLAKAPKEFLDSLVPISAPGFHVGLYANRVVFVVRITFVFHSIQA